MLSNFLSLLILLLAVHGLCDYAWQGDFMSRLKNRLIADIPFWIGLMCHAFIHAAAVLLVTRSLTQACVMLFTHGLIDYQKGLYRISARQDQLAHLGIVVAIAVGSTPHWWAGPLISWKL